MVNKGMMEREYTHTELILVTSICIGWSETWLTATWLLLSMPTVINGSWERPDLVAVNSQLSCC